MMKLTQLVVKIFGNSSKKFSNKAQKNSSVIASNVVPKTKSPDSLADSFEKYAPTHPLEGVY